MNFNLHYYCEMKNIKRPKHVIIMQQQHCANGCCWSCLLESSETRITKYGRSGESALAGLWAVLSCWPLFIPRRRSRCCWCRRRCATPPQCRRAAVGRCSSWRRLRHSTGDCVVGSRSPLSHPSPIAHSLYSVLGTREFIYSWSNQYKYLLTKYFFHCNNTNEIIEIDCLYFNNTKNEIIKIDCL